MPVSVTSLSKQLSEISERITDRKQSDLRFCHGVAKKAIAVARAYQAATKNGGGDPKIDKAMEGLLSE